MAKRITAKKTAQSVAAKNTSVLRPTQFKLRAVDAKTFPVKHTAEPPAFLQRESIHPRRVLPRIKEGMERAFQSSARQVMLDQPMLFGASSLRSNTDDVVIVTNTPLDQPARQRLASNVGEPSVAISGQIVMYTGNWYAARSVDGGQTFDFINPFKSFPDPPNLSFCCDQVVHYLPSIDTFVWLMQYGPTRGNPQSVRRPNTSPLLCTVSHRRPPQAACPSGGRSDR